MFTSFNMYSVALTRIAWLWTGRMISVSLERVWSPQPGPSCRTEEVVNLQHVLAAPVLSQKVSTCDVGQLNTIKENLKIQ